jgi:hypothetical protein
MQRFLAARRPAERGMLHGLSLLLLTVALFGAVAFFGLAKFPVRCACHDGSTREGTRSGFDSPDTRCEQICEGHGGGGAARREKKKDPSR